MSEAETKTEILSSYFHIEFACITLQAKFTKGIIVIFSIYERRI